MPRKSQVPFDDLVRLLREKIDIIFPNNGLICVGPSNKVWDDLSIALNRKKSNKAIYTDVKTNRNNILHQLGKGSSAEQGNEENSFFELKESDGVNDDVQVNECSINNVLQFQIRFTAAEWHSMKVKDVRYHEKRNLKGGKSYTIFEPGKWTPIFHSQVYKATQLLCPITYKRAKIFKESENYCTVEGYCRSCGSTLKAVCKYPPRDRTEILDVTFRCVYKGPYKECTSTEKRRMTSSQTNFFVREQIDRGISADIIRRGYANEVMDFGDLEPPHIPTSNALRVAKSKALQKHRIHDDPIIGLCIMKYSNAFSNSIHDIGYDRFFCHYWTNIQISMYREYVKNSKCPSVSVDATGGIVRKPQLIGGRKTKTIYLYEIAFYDQKSKIQVSVGDMLSERHNNNSICHWLMEWLRSGAPLPKQVVTDMSLALLSGVVRAFTTFTSVWDYIKFCYHLCSDPNQKM